MIERSESAYSEGGKVPLDKELTKDPGEQAGWKEGDVETTPEGTFRLTDGEWVKISGSAGIKEER